MTIAEIKAVISTKYNTPIGTLDLRGEEDSTTGVVDLSWQYCWLDEPRVRIVFPQEVVDTIKADKSFNGLAAKFEVIPAHKAGDINPVTKKAWSSDLDVPYSRVTVITPKFTASF